MTEKVPTELAGALVREPSGDRVRLGDLWVSSPVVLVLVRHFG